MPAKKRDITAQKNRIVITTVLSGVMIYVILQQIPVYYV